MKNCAPNSSQSPTPAHLSGSLLKLSLILFAACLGLFATAARAQVNELDVGVRARLADKPVAPPLAKSNLPSAPEHGKVYGIVAVQLIPEEGKLVKPVDASKLMDQVRHELDTHGFRQVVKGQKPDILLLVQYGRAWLWNPYFEEAQALQTGAESMPVQQLGMANSKVMMRLHEHGVEAKSQKAEFEKLCIRVIAFQYPTDPKAHAKRLWDTIMYVDDPDHRDLNAVAAKMLEAGAPYFDKDIKEEELDVNKPLPEGQVNVGTPQVVEPKPKDK